MAIFVSGGRGLRGLGGSPQDHDAAFLEGTKAIARGLKVASSTKNKRGALRTLVHLFSVIGWTDAHAQISSNPTANIRTLNAWRAEANKVYEMWLRKIGE